MRSRSRRALQAGLTALLAFMLTSALFSAPLLAAQHDFGHTHPEGTPHHVHTVHAVLGAGAPTAPLLAVPFTLGVFSSLQPFRTLPLAAAAAPLYDSRAPPTN